MKKTTDLWIAAACEDQLEESATILKGMRQGQVVFVFNSDIDIIENKYRKGSLRIDPRKLKQRVYDLKDRTRLLIEEE